MLTTTNIAGRYTALLTRSECRFPKIFVRLPVKVAATRQAEGITQLRACGKRKLFVAAITEPRAVASGAVRMAGVPTGQFSRWPFDAGSAPRFQNLRSAVVGKAATIRYDKGPGVAAKRKQHEPSRPQSPSPHHTPVPPILTRRLFPGHHTIVSRARHRVDAQHAKYQC